MLRRLDQPTLFRQRLLESPGGVAVDARPAAFAAADEKSFN
jgi:hypothetical protein